jgi:hypothetical protein
MDEQFDPLAIVLEYRRLGGQREVVVQGSNMHMNAWEPEPDAARDYWNKVVDALSPEERVALLRALAEVGRS